MGMTFEEIKAGVLRLTPEERAELSTYLHDLRHPKNALRNS